MQKPLNVEVIGGADVPDPARRAAEDWLTQIEQAKGPCRVALSGGKSAEQFFAAATALAQRRRTSFEKVQFFWSDERCVPPTDSESNFALAHRLLLAPLNIPAGRIHRIKGEIPPQSAAQEAEAELAAEAFALDLVFVGLGEDAHIASLFPQADAAVVNSPALFIPVTGPKPPPRRVTMSYKAIASATQLWVLAFGPNKEGALKSTLVDGAATPFGHLLRLRSSSRIYCHWNLPGQARPAPTIRN